MRTFNSLFSQLLAIFSRADFAAAVRQHRAERAVKGFDCWTQFVARLFCQLGGARSLREICGGLARVEGKLNHLGVGAVPRCSTPSYANAHRPAALFQDIFDPLLARCQSIAAPRKFRLKNNSTAWRPLLAHPPASLFPSSPSVIDLLPGNVRLGEIPPHQGRGGSCLLLDHYGHLPCFGVITAGKVHEIRVARSLDLPPDTILAIDRGYLDYLWLDQLDARGGFFVTRLKEGAVFHVEAELSAPKDHILPDEGSACPAAARVPRPCGSFAGWSCGMKPGKGRSCD